MFEETTTTQGIQDGGSSADYAIVVSLPKTGTNLVAKLMTSLGYNCVGQGIKSSYDEMFRKLARFCGPGDDPRDGFSYPDRMMSILPEYPAKTCLFLHRLEITCHLLDWLQSRQPPIFFNFRDPRDSLISLVNYLVNKSGRGFTPLPINLIYSDILSDLHSEDDRINFAIKFLDDHNSRFRNHIWMLKHPHIFNIRYEDLVGSRGGGSNDIQDRLVSGVAAHLGLSIDAQSVANGLYDISARTFRKGKIGAWRTAFSNKNKGLFHDRFGDVLDCYGYPMYVDSQARE